MMSRTSLLAAAACLAMVTAAQAQSSSTGSTTNFESGSSMSGGASTHADPDTVRQVQQGLKDKGYDPGPVDGVMGPQTKSALREWQQSQGMEASGSLDDASMGALGVTANRSGSGAPSGQDKTTSPSLRENASTVGADPSMSGSAGGAAGARGSAGTPNRSGSGAPSGDDATTSPTQRDDATGGGASGSMRGSSSRGGAGMEGSGSAGTPNRSGSGTPSGDDATTSPTQRDDQQPGTATNPR